MNLKELIRLVESQNKGFIPLFHRVALAVSGGADSIALFHVFLEFFKKKYFSDLIILHVNFGLRGEESDRDQRLCETLAAENGLMCRVLKVNRNGDSPRKPGESTQMWARRVRMSWFDEQYNLGFQIALGHNADDLAENVLIRLARGTKSENLAGMRRLDGMLWRPLLGVPKEELRDALIRSSLNWGEDSSNSSAKYARNRIRNEVIPLLESIFPGSKEHITQWALHRVDQPQTKGEAKNSRLEPAVTASNHSKIKAIESFMATSRSGQLFRLSAQHWLVCKDSAPKAPSRSIIRESQHLASLDGRNIELILSKGTGFTSTLAIMEPRKVVGSKEHCFTDESPDCAGVIFLKAQSPKDEVKIAESIVAFKFKDLMQKWSIPVLDRVSFVSISLPNEQTIFCRMVKKPSYNPSKLEF